MAKPLKVAVVGSVGRGRSFFRAIAANPHTVLHALCDIQEERLRAQAAELGVRKAYTSYEELLDKARPDCVVIGTPMPLHAPQAIVALERNIHVMSEVPAGVSYEECRALVCAARRSRAKYMMAENYCYMRSNVLVRALAHAGLFGEIYYGEGGYIHELKGLNEITKWRRKWQTGINGNTYPTHSLGPLLQWIGQRVVAVCCAGSGHHYRDSRGDTYEIEDSVTTLCRLSGGGLLDVRLDMLSNRPHNMVHYQIQGTKGCYISPRGKGDRHLVWVADRCPDADTWRDLEEFADEFLPDCWKHPTDDALKAGHGGSDYFEVMDFVDAILADREPPIGIDAAMDFTLPGLASQESIAKGSVWVDVPDSREW